jgi:hypothetical protein
VLIRVAHDVIDRDPDLAAMDDALCDAVKIRASKAQISYAPHVLTAAVEAAIRQRTPPQKAKTGKVSRAERAQAVQIRDRVHGRCPHDPHCLNYNACITTIVEERREQDRRVEHARRRRTA